MAQRPNDLTPHASPAHFWGAELRTRREAKGLSLEALGKLVYRDRSFLAKIEKGQRTISAELARACDQAIGADGTLIRLHSLVTSPDGAHVAEPSSARGHVAKSALHVAKQSALVAPDASLPSPLEGDDEQVSVPARTPDGRVIFVSVSRRYFMRGMAAAALAPALSDRPTSSITAVRVPAISSAPDVHPVEHFGRMLKVLIDSDNLFGPDQVIPTVTEQINLIQSLRQGKRGADQQALLDTQAKFAEFAGWLHQDHGDHVGAEYWTNRALEWSHGARDADLTTFILARGANLAADMADPVRSLDLASAAENMARPGSRLAAVAATFAGHGYALQGDVDGTHRAYEHARELLTTLDDDPDSPWGVWLDSAYVDVHQYRSFVLVGEYEAAAEGFESAIEALPQDFHRDRGVYLARAARAYAGAGEVEHASLTGRQALAIGLETKSGRILTELSELNDALNQWHTPAVTEFRAAMAETIGRQV